MTGATRRAVMINIEKLARRLRVKPGDLFKGIR